MVITLCCAFVDDFSMFSAKCESWTQKNMNIEGGIYNYLPDTRYIHLRYKNDCLYWVSQFIFLYFERQLYHPRNRFLLFEIHFHILQT